MAEWVKYEDNYQRILNKMFHLRTLWNNNQHRLGVVDDHPYRMWKGKVDYKIGNLLNANPTNGRSYLYTATLDLMLSDHKRMSLRTMFSIITTL